MSPVMSYFFFIAAIVACFLVLAVLLFGIFSFSRGGEFNRKYSNKIMRIRIVAQVVAVVLILIAVLAAKSGS